MESNNSNYRLYLWGELSLLFVVIPISLSLDIPLWIKACATLLGIVYILYISKKVGLLSKRIFSKVFSAEAKKSSLISLVLVLVATSSYTYFADASLLFKVPITKPVLWLGICLFYTLFSAFPQEFIYRVFFYNRYRLLFGTHFVFVLYNSLLFSLAHLMFGNSMVLIITFIGGLLFNYSYSKNQSYLLVSLEHSVYGCWLFTIGMGEMLAFPV
ncbi:MAG: CPBP family intramembrane metalloprotease [Flavobacteriales bacterium]|nr:CPBP family intramembrane metalloprotease [Flavobacteriales bacterium]